MRDIVLGETIYFLFTTRQYSDGAPTTLSGTPVLSAYEENNLTQITSGVSISADYDGVTGLNQGTIVATTGNTFEVGKSYDIVITTGTVGGTSVVGEVVYQFTIEASAALQNHPTNFADMSIAVTTGLVDITQTAADKVWGTAARVLTAATNIFSSGSALNTTGGVLDTVTTATASTDVTNDVGITQAGADKVWGTTTRTVSAATNITSAGTAINTTAGAVDTVTTLTNLPAITTDWLTAAGTAADFGTEVGTAVWATAARTLTASTNFNDISTADVNAQVDLALSDIGLDHLISSALPTSWATDVAANSVFDQIADDGTANYDRTTDSLQAAADAAGGTPPTAADIADAVWEEAQADHTTGTTFGAIATEIADVQTQVGTAGAGLTNIGTIATVTNLTNLPTIPANWLTAAGTATDFGTEIGTAVWANGTKVLTAATNITSDGSAINVSSGVIDTVTTLTDFSTTTRAEPGQGTPGATVSPALKLDYLYKFTINQKDNSGTETQYYNNAASVVDHQSATTASGGTTTVAKILTGP